MNKATSTPDVMRDQKTIHDLREEHFKNDEEIFRLSLENLKLQGDLGLLPGTKSKEAIQRLRDEKSANEKRSQSFRSVNAPVKSN